MAPTRPASTACGTPAPVTNATDTKRDQSATPETPIGAVDGVADRSRKLSLASPTDPGVIHLDGAIRVAPASAYVHLGDADLIGFDPL
jgi:hypothetical protein